MAAASFLLRNQWVAVGLAAGLLLAGASAQAQSKATFPWSAALGGQVNYLTGRNHAVLLRARLERSFDGDYNALGRDEGGGQLARAVVLGGYEWRLGERWSGGLVEKITFDPGSTRTFQTGGFLRHCGHIGSVQFRKRALAEHISQQTPGLAPPDGGRIRFRVDLDRTWQVGNIGLRPRLAYEIQFDVALKKTEASTKDTERVVDRGVLRVELAVDLSDKLSVVPYVARVTEFTTAIAQYNADGSERVKEGPRNLRYPTVGIDVRYTLFSAKPHTPPAGRDLPTFEGFQD